VLALGIITMIVSTGRFITMMYTDNYISICENLSLAAKCPHGLVKADSPLYNRHLGDRRILSVHHGRGLHGSPAPREQSVAGYSIQT